MIRLDDTDRIILERLGRDARASWKSLAEEVGLSAPSVMERVRKLERGGLLRGYAALLDPAELGLEMLAFVFLVGSGPDYYRRLEEQVAAMPEIQECHVTSGSYDYLLKIRCSSSRHLMDVLQALRADEGVRNTETTVALATMKETVTLPLDAG